MENVQDPRASVSQKRERIVKLSRHLEFASLPSTSKRSSGPVKEKKEVAIIGMGFSGMVLTYKLREAGFNSIRSFEIGSDVGGTWFWNKYPGCACDVPSYQYSYAFSKELEQDWVWKHRYGTQSEILTYATHVADRFNLRSDTLFNTEVVSAVFDEAKRCWIVKSNHNDCIEAKFLFLANGCLSSPATPGISVSKDFEGKCFHTHDWDYSVTLRGKRVGIIGTGSTATQAIPELAKEVEHLYVLQRTPAWCAPRKDREISSEEEKEIKSDYGGYRGLKTVESGGNLGGNAGLTDVLREEADVNPPNKDEYAWWRSRLNQVARNIESYSPEVQKRFLENGGFGISYGFGAAEDEDAGDSSFGPLSNMKVNNKLKAYLSLKIRQEVDDPEIARKLTPKYPVACKRLCITDDYWKTFNKPNVTLIDLGGKSVKTVGKGGPYDHENKPLLRKPLDVLIFATGFNAMTGAADGQIGVLKGVNGVTLGEKYSKHGIETYLGMLTHGFPNCFFMVGPQSCSVLGNMINEGEKQADWLIALLKKMRKENYHFVNVKRESEIEWAKVCKETTAKTVWGGVGGGCKSWYNKANVAKRDKDGNLIDVKETITGGGDVLPFTGGETRYRELCVEYGFSGLDFE